MSWPPAVTLKGRHVHVVPLDPSHEDALSNATKGLEGLWYTWVPTPADMKADIARRMAAENMCAFTLMTPDGTPMGMTTFMHTDSVNLRVEIGSTWVGKDVQRSPFNTEAKYLLLQHAFEVLDCIAVEFRTHRLNLQSRRAIERLGAQLDGILRAHMVLPNGTVRDTAVYSITANEWPVIKAHLEQKLAQ